MNKFSKISWYEWVLYSLFALFSILIIWAALGALHSGFPELMPLYFNFLKFLFHAGNLVGTAPALLGIFLLITGKKYGWNLLFFGVSTFVLLSFIPVYGMDPEYIPRSDYSLVFFVLIPVALLFKRSQGVYQVSDRSLAVTIGFVLFVLALRFFSFGLLKLLM